MDIWSIAALCYLSMVVGFTCGYLIAISVENEPEDVTNELIIEDEK